MLTVHGVPLVMQLVVPLALLGWQAFGRDRTVAGWLVKTVIVALYLAAVATAGLWVVVPWQTPAVLLLIVVAIALWQLRSVRRLPWRTHLSLVELVSSSGGARGNSHLWYSRRQSMGDVFHLLR